MKNHLARWRPNKVRAWVQALVPSIQLMGWASPSQTWRRRQQCHGPGCSAAGPQSARRLQSDCRPPTRQRREEREVEGPSTAGTAPPANDSDSRVSRDELQTTGSSRQHRGVTMRVRMPSRRIGNLGVDRRGYGERSRVRHPSSTRARVCAKAAIMLQI